MAYPRIQITAPSRDKIKARTAKGNPIKKPNGLHSQSPSPSPIFTNLRLRLFDRNKSILDVQYVCSNVLLLLHRFSVAVMPVIVEKETACYQLLCICSYYVTDYINLFATVEFRNLNEGCEWVVLTLQKSSHFIHFPLPTLLTVRSGKMDLHWNWIEFD